jgi:hypothetical protein
MSLGSPEATADWAAAKLARWWEVLQMLLRRDSFKYASELGFWEGEWEKHHGKFQNSWYRQLMLALAGEESDEFLRGRVVADFGCGPLGSLCWAMSARERIGIDVLVDAYQRFGIAAHDMSYVRSTEREIPLPTGSVEVLFTINALDHVSHLSPICRELLRIMAPGCRFFGSFNLHEPRAACEPQTLTEGRLRRRLLDHLEVNWYAFAPKHAEKPYRAFLTNDVSTEAPRSPAIMWVRARKQGAGA